MSLATDVVTGLAVPSGAHDVRGALHAAAVAMKKTGVSDADDAHAALTEWCSRWQADVRPDAGEIAAEVSFILSKPMATVPEAMAPCPRGPLLGSEHDVARALALDPPLVRWCPPELLPLAWDGRKWKQSSSPVPLALQGAVHRCVGGMIEAGVIDARAGRHLESTHAMRAIAMQLADNPTVQLERRDLNPPGLLVTPGGVLDMATGAMEQHDPARPVTCCTGIDLDLTATDPMWQLVLDHMDALPDDGHAVIRRFVGAAAVGRAPDRKLLWLVGPGGDGKSTLLRILGAALGDYASAIPAEALHADGGRGAHGNELLSPLATHRLIAATEVPGSVNWPLLKAVSGGDARTTKRLHGRAFSFEPRCHLIVASNAEPTVPHGDQAARDRVVLVRWHRPICPEPELVRVLGSDGEERDSLLRSAFAWIVRGAAEYLRDGYGVLDGVAPDYEPPAGLARWWADSVAAGEVLPSQGWTPATEIQQRAEAWAANRGEDRPSTTALGAFLKSKVASCRRGSREGRDRRVLHYRLALGRGWDGVKSVPYTCVKETLLSASQVRPSLDGRPDDGGADAF